jgi:heme/copper-type cytochrome/quinol oxidase subunit 3
MPHDKKKHPFQIIDPSPWPLVASMGALLLTLGAVLAMHRKDIWVMIVGALMLIGAAAGWWRDMIHESKDKTVYTTEVKNGLKIGMLIFIGTEIMFFVSFFWAYFNASLFPSEVIGSVWPPKGLKTIDPFDLPYLNTLLLLLSGSTVTWAHHNIIEGRMKDFTLALGLTILLGLTFTCVQAFEYHHAPFLFKGGIYPSTFYMATGFHGLHVLLGTVFLSVCYFRAQKGHYTQESHTSFELAAWYWHFVDAVWLFLFVSIYYGSWK